MRVQILTLHLCLSHLSDGFEGLPTSRGCNNAAQHLSLDLSLFNARLSSGLCHDIDGALNYESGDLNSDTVSTE